MGTTSPDDGSVFSMSRSLGGITKGEGAFSIKSAGSAERQNRMVMGIYFHKLVSTS
jgi:hypothetical protein